MKFTNIANLLVIIILFWGLNHSLPMVMDDSSYAYCLDVNHYEAPHFANIDRPIENFGDIIRSQALHYELDNGRTPVHVIVQSFCGLFGKNVFDVLNAVMFALLLLLTAETTGNNTTETTETSTETGSFHKTQKFFLPILMLMVFLSEPKCWWNGIAHSVNYLWTTVAVLLFLLLLSQPQAQLRKPTRKPQKPQKPPRKLLLEIKKLFLPLLGLLAGWSHECLAVGVGAGLIYWIWKNWKTIGKWEIAGVVAFFVGAAFLVFSPANFIRTESDALGDILMRPVKFMYVVWPCLLLAVCVAVWLWTKKTLRKFLKENMFWVITIVVAAVFVIVSGVVTRRAVYGFELFTVLLCCKAVLKNADWANYSGFITIALLCVALPFQIAAGEQYREIDRVVMTHENDLGLDGEGRETVVIPMENIVAPRIFNKYICRFLTDEECRGSEDKGNTAFQEWMWEWKGKYEHELMIFCY